jgi:integrase
MFDARAAKALGAGDLLTFDGAPGLRLVATASVRTWTYRYKAPDGRMRQVKLGRWPAMSFPAALAAWQAVKTERDAGGDPALERRTRRREVVATARLASFTVRQACSDFLADYEGTVAAKTYGEAQRTLERDLGDLADRPAAELTRSDAFGLLHAMRDRPVQAARLRQLLGAAWDRAHDAGRLGPDVPNWWRLVLRGKLASKGKVVGGKHQGSPEKRVLSEAELGLLLPWLPNFTRDVEDALTLYLWTCCRGVEIVAMEAEEVATEAGVLWWTLPKAKLKMLRHPLIVDLRVPLVGRAEAIVRRRMEVAPKGYLFPSHGRSGHIEQKALGVAVWTHMPACELRPEWVRPRLPVAAWAPHDLRRTGRTLLAAMGCPNEVAEAIIGHLPPGVQGVYNRHQYDRERLAWLSRLSSRLEELAAPGRAGGRSPAARRPPAPAPATASRRGRG